MAVVVQTFPSTVLFVFHIYRSVTTLAVVGDE